MLTDLLAYWPLLTRLEVGWLWRSGVTPRAMASPFPLGSARVRFDLDRFDLDLEHDAKGERAVLILALDRGEPVDLVAWAPRSGRLGLLIGCAPVLGDLDDLTNPATFFDGDGLRVHRTPLDWLRADRAGVVPINPQILRDCRRLIFADADHAKQIRRALESSVEFIIEIEEGKAA
jgi:hypothetical protein